jgi:hypothetical protein
MGTGIEGLDRSVDVMVSNFPVIFDISALGLTLLQDKRLGALVQQVIVTAHFVQHEGEIQGIETVASSAISLIRTTSCAKA